VWIASYPNGGTPEFFQQPAWAAPHLYVLGPTSGLLSLVHPIHTTPLDWQKKKATGGNAREIREREGEWIRRHGFVPWLLIVARPYPGNFNLPLGVWPWPARAGSGLTGIGRRKPSSAAGLLRSMVMLHHLRQALGVRPGGKPSAHGCLSRLRLGGTVLQTTGILRRCGCSAAPPQRTVGRCLCVLDSGDTFSTLLASFGS
jgi:hypothetical protein